MSKWRVESGYLGRYLGVGTLNTLVGFAVIFLLMWLGASPVAANVAGYAVGFLLGFVLTKKLVFRSNGHFVVESFRYLVAFLVSFLLNLSALRISLDVLNFSAGAVPNYRWRDVYRLHVFADTSFCRASNHDDSCCK